MSQSLMESEPIGMEKSYSQEMENIEHLKTFLHDIEQKNGEGVVLRDPKALYLDHRSSKALKVKSFLDKECTITAYNEGHGKFKGLLGSVTCKLDNNVTFEIGSGFSIEERKNPPKIGSLITFKFKEFTKYGKPRFTVYLRIRKKIVQKN